jgi:hypothetical protein
MFDTIKLWLPIDEAGSFDDSKILQSLNNTKQHCNTVDGQVYYTGSLGNCRVSLSGQGISLKGSLAKYFLPDNFHTLTRSDTKRAFEKMADDLHIPIQRAKVTRIDFAKNMLMNYNPEAYYSFLGETQHYKRLPQDKSIYYSNGLRQMVFYNKVAEGKAKRQSLPDVWNGQNILRYELRFTKKLTKQFKRPEIKANTLTDEKFYMELVNKWIAEYEANNKLHSINFNLSDMNSPKDFIKQLSLFAVQMIGQDKIMAEIENLRLKKAFDKPEYYSRLKKDIRELCKTPELTNSSDLVAELDKKIKTSKQYYR